MTVTAAVMTAAMMTATVTGCIMDVDGIMLMDMYRIEVHVDGIVMRMPRGIGMQRIAMMSAQRIEVQRVAGMPATVVFAAASVCCRQIRTRELIITCTEGVFLTGIHNNRKCGGQKQEFFH